MENSLNIPDDAFYFKFKKNCENDEDDGLEFAYLCLNYLENKIDGDKDDIIYTCLGKHVNGENKIPHHHFVAITRKDLRCKSNKSKSLLDFAKANNVSRDDFGKTVFEQYDPKKGTKFDSLAYPLKEAMGYWGIDNRSFYKGLKKTEYDALMDLGHSLYLKKLGDGERRDRHEEKKRNAYERYVEFVSNVKRSNYKDHVLASNQYYLTLNDEDKPTTSNMMEYIKKKGLCDGLITFLDLMKV